MIEVVGGASTTSRRPDRTLTALYAVSAKGNRVTLTDEREYVDWQMGMHGVLGGYNPPWLRSAYMQALANGPITSIRSRDEPVVAEMLTQFYPDLEGGGVRFFQNGSDACGAAVKIARAVNNGRDRLVCYGYHGTSSAYAQSPDNRPNLQGMDMSRGTLAAERAAYIPLDWLEWPIEPLTNVAAVIVETPPDDRGRYVARTWLHNLFDMARECGAVTVLDEVVTGFRYAPGGSAEYYSLQGKVDLYCFGKTLGSGVPIAALAGKLDLMRSLIEGVHWSNTFNANPAGLAAAKATLRELLDNPPWEHLGFMGRYLKEQWNAIDLPYKLIGHPTRPIIDDATIDDKFTDLRRHLFRRGHIIVDHPWFVSTATTKKDVDDLVDAAKEWSG